MGDNFKKVQAGQPLQIPAEAYNAFLDAARAERARRHSRRQDSLPPFRQADIILVRNDSGQNRARFDVLGLTLPIVLPGANLQQFQNQVALGGSFPLVADHAGRFVVLLEPLEAGRIGRAWAAGACPARVNVSDPCHEYADVADLDPTALRSVPRGAARILWREGGLGVQWAVVRLGDDPPPLRRFRLLERLDRCGSAAARRVVFSQTASGNPMWCETDCDFTLFDSLGIVPSEGVNGGSFGWAIWMIDSDRWEVVALGEGCCGSSSSSGSWASSSSSPSYSSSSLSSSDSGSSSGSGSSSLDSGSSSEPGSSVTVQETDVRCENDKLNVYKRTVTITLTNHRLSQTTGPWVFSHQAGCCCCASCSGSSSDSSGLSDSSGNSTSVSDPGGSSDSDGDPGSSSSDSVGDTSSSSDLGDGGGVSESVSSDSSSSGATGSGSSTSDSGSIPGQPDSSSDFSSDPSDPGAPSV